MHSWALQGLEVDAASAAVESNRSLGAPLSGIRSWFSPLAYQWIPISPWGGRCGTFHTFLTHQSSFSRVMTEECAAGLTLVQLAEISRCRSRIKFLSAS